MVSIYRTNPVIKLFREEGRIKTRKSHGPLRNFKSFLGISGRLRSTSIMDAIHRFQGKNKVYDSFIIHYRILITLELFLCIILYLFFI